jgi:glycosyltransferase involved in cell wall biosynthesis
MCSDAAETWGWSTNEAMNFGLPIIVYDTVGCCPNLVNNEENGYRVGQFDIPKLAEGMKILASDAQKHREFGQKSQTVISNYSYAGIIKGLLSIG